MSSGIYIIKNNVNGKVYVGSAINLKQRWYRHISSLRLNKHHSSRLQNSVNKYGLENFEFISVQYCNREELISNEQFWIDYFDSYNNGLNGKPKAGNSLGFKHSNESKKKISELAKGNKRCVGRLATQKTKDAVSKTGKRFKGKKQSEEQKIKRGIYKTKFNYEEAFKMYCDGFKVNHLAIHFNVDRHTISKALNKFK